MANWNNRINNYRQQLTALQKQGWLTQAEVSSYWNSRTDDAFQRGIGVGNRNRDNYIAQQQHTAALQRTGGLERPSGGSWDDRYFKQFTGFTKAELEEASSPQVVESGSFKAGQGYVEKEKLVSPDLTYYVNTAYQSAYDPEFARKQLSGNKRWELQSEAVGKVIAQAGAIKYQRETLPKLQAEAKQKETARKQNVLSSWNVLGRGALSSQPNLSATFPTQRANMGVTSAKQVIRPFNETNRARPDATTAALNAIAPISGGRSGRSTAITKFRDRPVTYSGGRGASVTKSTLSKTNNITRSI
jgi:hypothetical protein